MFIEIHAIQSLPPSNPNRGKNGDIKSVMYGGVLRSRISSQAQKRSAREWYSANATIDRKQLASRSRLHHLELINHLQWAPTHQRDSIARILVTLLNSGAENIFQGALEMKNLVFLADHELHKIGVIAESAAVLLGDLADRLESYKIWDADQKKKQKTEASEPVIEVEENTKKAKKKEKEVFAYHPTKAEIKTVEKLIVNQLIHSVPGDIALFGRMMATLTEVSVDGSVQVAHAISVNPLPRTKSDQWRAGEIDFFAAIDDKKGPVDSGAGMIGEVSFAAPVHYRYANICFHELEKLMGDRDAAKQSVAAFIEGFVRSLPDGYSTQFAHATLPEFVLIQVKDTCPYGLSSAFLTPIDRPDKSFPSDPGGISISQSAVTALMDRRTEFAEMYDEEFSATAIVSLKDHYPNGQSLKTAIESITEAL